MHININVIIITEIQASNSVCRTTSLASCRLSRLQPAAPFRISSLPLRVFLATSQSPILLEPCSRPIPRPWSRWLSSWPICCFASRGFRARLLLSLRWMHRPCRGRSLSTAYLSALVIFGSTWDSSNPAGKAVSLTWSALSSSSLLPLAIWAASSSNSEGEMLAAFRSGPWVSQFFEPIPASGSGY